MSLDRMLRERMTILTRQQTKSLTGANSVSWTAAQQSIRCQRQQMSSERKIELGIPQSRPAFVLYYLGTTQLTPENRVRVGSVQYEIVDVEPTVDRRKPAKAAIIKAENQ